VSTTPVADLLATIVAATRRGIEFREGERPLAQLERETTRAPEGRRFVEALRGGETPRIIAECKRRSPSRGILRADYDAATHARQYADAGAAAISVLTEPTFFDGAPEHLRAVRAAVSVPVLRKDFIVSEYQLAEAAWLGADAVLLIVGALDDLTLAHLLGASRRRGLAALVEVHDRNELARAVDSGAEVIGVNSRNLRTLSVNQDVLDRVVADIPSPVVKVAESGIKSLEDITRLSRAGYDAFLVGERLIATPDPGAALRELRGR
jgi:indole-3-glycerol phosphate synthase